VFFLLKHVYQREHILSGFIVLYGYKILKH